MDICTGKVKRLVFSPPPLDQFAFKLSIRRLRQRQRDEMGIEDILDTVFHFRGFGRYRSIEPLQIRQELHHFAERVSELEPDTVLEIGSANGGTLYVWTRYLKTADQLVSLDMPGGSFGGGYDGHQQEFFKQFDPNTDIHCIRDNSHAKSTKRQVQSVLGDKQVDFLFIDGDHTYGGVKSDFEMYSPLVRDGGIIAFHDIVEHLEDENCEVDSFWDELKKEYETEEIIATSDQTWAGIGIVHV